MTTAAAIALRRPATAALTARGLVAAVLGSFALDNLLLLHFWGLSLPLTFGVAAAATAMIWLLCGRISDEWAPVPLSTVAIAFTLALTLLALGGEGRFFYANTDWQVRDAVLQDLATNPWPFAYVVGGKAFVLRAPLGTYLLPAMFGTNAGTLLLVSNAFRLALLLSLSWYLFEGKQQRLIGLLTFVFFSGWDLAGTLLYSFLGAHLSWDHIERWNFGYQYSSHVTQAFWVPQHAIAGWTCALFFMLWRKGVVPIGSLAASILLVAIWSPLAIMGAVPFALIAAFTSLHRQEVKLGDVALAALALAIALPALLYLQLDARSVGMHFLAPSLVPWILCIGLEVLPFAWPLLRSGASPAADRQLVLIILLLLIGMPLVQVGVSSDFQMRASIMPLALLSILFAQWICRLLEGEPVPREALGYALIAISLGAATPFLEVRRALVNRPSPRPLCSLVGVWYKQDNMIVPFASYLAPVSKLPEFLRPVPVTSGRSDPEKCWDRKWMTPV